jgi:hypothetical protein
MAAKKRKTRRQLPKPSFASRRPPPSTADALVYTEYAITDEPLENRDIKKLPAPVQARIDTFHRF